MSSVPRTYESMVDQRLADVATRPGATLDRVFGEMLGVFPTETLSRIEARYPELLEARCETTRPLRVRTRVPELHPLDYEWYFTDDTARSVAVLFADSRTAVACLGAPTVAEALAASGRDAVLYDRNPLLLKRLAQANHFEFVTCDLAVAPPPAASFGGAFFDAPWYPEYAALWLLRARQLVPGDGVIAFSLFPALTRPAAHGERADLLALAGRLGNVDVHEGALEYETPRFEEAILERHGIVGNRWRHADLVVISARASAGMLPNRFPPTEDRWDTFLLDTQVVKLKVMPDARSGWLVLPLASFPDYVAETVSRRDPSRPAIDIWTSRNRVARVGNRAAMANVLRALSEGQDLSWVIKMHLGDLTPAEREITRIQLTEIFELREGRL